MELAGASPVIPVEVELDNNIIALRLVKLVMILGALDDHTGLKLVNGDKGLSTKEGKVLTIAELEDRVTPDSLLLPMLTSEELPNTDGMVLLLLNDDTRDEDILIIDRGI